MSLYVQKYGGTSVGSLERIRSVAAHIAQTFAAGHRVVVVVSAMGQQTDELLDMALQLSSRPPQREVDMLLTVGERISMSLLAIALNEYKIPTLSLTGSQSGILTDNTFGNARIQRILGDRIRLALQQQKLVIVAGFQGMSEFEKEITTLGRGGSDLTAIALAHALKADRCQIYKDVDGVCSADPRLVPSAGVISEMSWDTLAHLTSYGSGVVHHRGVHLAKKFKIPLEIRSSFNFSTPGTQIGSYRAVEKAQVFALTHRQELSWIGLQSCPTDSHVLSSYLNYLWAQGEHPLFIQQSSKSGKNSIELVCASKYVSGLRDFSAQNFPAVVVEDWEQKLALITLVGDGFWLEPEILTKAQTQLNQKPKLIECKNSVLNLLVRQEGLEENLQSLHRQFLES